MVNIREWNKIQCRVLRSHHISSVTDVLLLSDRVRCLRCCDYLTISYIEKLVSVEAYIFKHFSNNN